MKLKRIVFYFFMMFTMINAVGQINVKNKYAHKEPPEHINRNYPPVWEQLVPDGRFMDRFLPMQETQINAGQIWGVTIRMGKWRTGLNTNIQSL